MRRRVSRVRRFDALPIGQDPNNGEFYVNAQSVPPGNWDFGIVYRNTSPVTGDSIITRKLSVYSEPAFMRIIELVRGADVAFTNLEMLFHDYEPYAANESGGTSMRADPALVNDLVWAGSLTRAGSARM